MDFEQVIKWFDEQTSNSDYSHIKIPEEIYHNLQFEEAKKIADIYGGSTFIKLPKKEITFFEWLKKEDKDVWMDLWGDMEEEPYVVGLNFLPVLIYSENRGFPICDLVENDNYYFTPSHMVDAESRTIIEAATNKFKDRKKLTYNQLLALEISLNPIDIWHFSYKHRIPVETAKEAVEELKDDNALVHLKEAEHLATFVDF